MKVTRVKEKTDITQVTRKTEVTRVMKVIILIEVTWVTANYGSQCNQLMSPATLNISDEKSH